MLRALPSRLVFLAGKVMLGMVISTSAVLACTAAGEAFATSHDDGDTARAGVVKMSATAQDPNLMAPGEGLKLRTRQQDTVLSAALTERPSSSRLSSRPSPTQSTQSVQVAQVAPDSASDHGGKPLAMLAAALVLMVSIALRRSGKR